MKKLLTMCVIAGIWALSPGLMAKTGDGDKEDEKTKAEADAKAKKNKDGGGGGGKKKAEGGQNQDAPRKQNSDKPSGQRVEPKQDRPPKEKKTENPDRPKKNDGPKAKEDAPGKAERDKSRDDSPKNKSAQGDGNRANDQQGKQNKQDRDGAGGGGKLSGGDQEKKDRPGGNEDPSKDKNQGSKKDRETVADRESKSENDKRDIDKDRDVKIKEDNRKQVDIDKDRDVKIKEDNRKQVDIDKDRDVKIKEDNRKQVDIDKDRDVKIKEDNRKQVDIDKERNVKINEDNRKQVNIDKSRVQNTEINKNITNINIDRRPGKGDRPPRVERRQEWNEVHVKNQDHWRRWREQNTVQVVKFREERRTRWTKIVHHEQTWVRRYHAPEYRVWRRDVWDYRRNRAVEIWDRRQARWDDCFDSHWFGYVAWRPAPRVYVNASPWWWWRPFAWGNATVFFGGRIAARPVVYDPGTTVVYEGDNYYVDGEPRGSAVVARRSARALASPKVAQIPVPEPAEEGEPEMWQPLGVWALAQQEEGDATMFMQLSVNREGLVAGAYKNVMTGEEEPIVGQLDPESQKLAWHVGEATNTVYETGLSNLENDVASVFVHFGEAETQTWLLVRLPSPELPPATVKIPEYLAQN